MSADLQVKKLYNLPLNENTCLKKLLSEQIFSLDISSHCVVLININSFVIFEVGVFSYIPVST